MSVTVEMPACQLFDAIFSRWLGQFNGWKLLSLPPEALHELAFEYSNRSVAEFSRSLTRETGAPFRAQIDAAVYALAALIDETVLYSDWPALSYWQACPLEYHLWQTHSAGDQLPQRIRALLEERNPTNRDLAALYLRCLTLGFGSRRQGFDDEAHRESCRLLWRFAFQHEAAAEDIIRRLEEQALDQPLQLPSRRRLPDNSRLHLIAAAALIALLLLSQRLWLSIDEAIGAGSLPDFPVALYCQGEEK